MPSLKARPTATEGAKRRRESIKKEAQARRRAHATGALRGVRGNNHEVEPTKRVKTRIKK
tara:strand:- start:1927 stop:2106 length:180 start_codon:yes stop_codon:yes gene_type:complete